MFTGGRVVLDIGKAEAATPFVFPVLNHGDREARHVGIGHELRYGGLDLGEFFGGKFGLRWGVCREYGAEEGSEEELR